MNIRKIIKFIFTVTIIGLICCMIYPPIYDYYKSPTRRVNTLLKDARSIAKSEGEFAGVIFEKGKARIFKSDNKTKYYYCREQKVLDFLIDDCVVIFSPYGPPVLTKIEIEGRQYAGTFNLNIAGKEYEISPYHYDSLIAKK